jgi:hypothetical protein
MTKEETGHGWWRNQRYAWQHEEQPKQSYGNDTTNASILESVAKGASLAELLAQRCQVVIKRCQDIQSQVESGQITEARGIVLLTQVADVLS